jgi:hypothetical protein
MCANSELRQNGKKHTPNEKEYKEESEAFWDRRKNIGIQNTPTPGYIQVGKEECWVEKIAREQRSMFLVLEKKR